MRDDFVRNSLARCEEAYEQERQRVTELEQEIAALRAKLEEARHTIESIALVTAYDQPLPGSLVGHVKMLGSELLQAEARAQRLEEALVTAVEIVHELAHEKGVAFADCTAPRCVDARAYARHENPPSLPETQ